MDYVQYLMCHFLNQLYKLVTKTTSTNNALRWEQSNKQIIFKNIFFDVHFVRNKQKFSTDYWCCGGIKRKPTKLIKTTKSHAIFLQTSEKINAIRKQILYISPKNPYIISSL